jgi:hypothetical protein
MHFSCNVLQVASLYKKGPYYYVSYRAPDGKWKDRSTGYRWDSPGGRIQAARLCKKLTAREHKTPRRRPSGDWSFVPGWLTSRYRDRTLKTYLTRWQPLIRWMASAGVRGPDSLTRQHCLEYFADRESKGTNRNTAAAELKFLAMALDEAKARGVIDSNPARNLRLAREPVKEKRPFSDDELARLDTALLAGCQYQLNGLTLTANRYSWHRAAFILGRYQASRIGQCALPLDCIDFDAARIHWPAHVVKGAKSFSQQIDHRLLPELRELVASRRTEGKLELCEPPVMSSLHFRHLLDSLGLTGVSHHSLRVRWISEAAKAGWPESAAMRFSNHSSVMVARIYQKFSHADVADMLKRLS